MEADRALWCLPSWHLKRRDPPKHEKNGPLFPYLELDAPIGLPANSMGFGINTNCLEGMLMSITIQLVGSASATFGEYGYTARGNGHDPIPPLVRSLIAEKVIDADARDGRSRGARLLQAVPGHPVGRD